MSEKDEQPTKQDSPEVEGHAVRMEPVERPATRSDEDESPDFEGHAHFRKGRANKGRARKGRA